MTNAREEKRIGIQPAGSEWCERGMAVVVKGVIDKWSYGRNIPGPVSKRRNGVAAVANSIILQSMALLTMYLNNYQA